MAADPVDRRKKRTVENPSRQSRVAPPQSHLSSLPDLQAIPGPIPSRLVVAAAGLPGGIIAASSSPSPAAAGGGSRSPPRRRSRRKQRCLIVAIAGGYRRSVSSSSSPSPAASPLPRRSSLPAGGAPSSVDHAHTGEEGTTGTPGLRSSSILVGRGGEISPPPDSV